MTTPAVTHSEASAEATVLLSLQHVSKRFGQNTVLRDVSLEIAAGEFLSVLGESGSGKTTLLRLIAGFEQPDSGEIQMAGERIDCLPPYRRRVNTVFQSYALFPHLSVFENVAYGLRVASVPKNEMRERARDALTMVKMTAFAEAKPARLSGGQQQRVALARALVNRPKLLLLDEPLSALDANLRREMQFELKSLQREVGIAFVFVTHDQEEAMTVSDRVALLRQGRLEQVGSPREIYSHPATAYAARFIGHSNLLRCEIRDGVARCGRIAFPAGVPDGRATFSLRPECIVPIRAGSPADGQVRFGARILRHAFQGATESYELDCGDGLHLHVQTGLVPSGAEAEFQFSPDDAVPVADQEL